MPLSAEQAYHFDVRGWLVADAALSLEQLQACLGQLHRWARH